MLLLAATTLLLCARPVVSAATSYQKSFVRDRSVVSIGWSRIEWKIDGESYPKFQPAEAITKKTLRFLALTTNKYSAIDFVFEDQMLLRQHNDSSDAMLAIVSWIVLSIGLFLTSEIIYKYYKSPMKRKSFVDDEHSVFVQVGGVEETSWELPKDGDVVVEDT